MDNCAIFLPCKLHILVSRDVNYAAVGNLQSISTEIVTQDQCHIHKKWCHVLYCHSFTCNHQDYSTEFLRGMKNMSRIIMCNTFWQLYPHT